MIDLLSAPVQLHSIRLHTFGIADKSTAFVLLNNSGSLHFRLASTTGSYVSTAASPQDSLARRALRKS